MLTSAQHWAELVAQIGPREAFGGTWLTKRVRPQLGIDTKLQTSAHVETAHVAVGCALKSTGLSQATQMHLSTAMVGSLNPVILPAVDQLATIRPRLGRSAMSNRENLGRPMSGWVTAR